MGSASINFLNAVQNSTNHRQDVWRTHGPVGALVSPSAESQIKEKGRVGWAILPTQTPPGKVNAIPPYAALTKTLNAPCMCRDAIHGAIHPAIRGMSAKSRALICSFTLGSDGRGAPTRRRVSAETLSRSYPLAPPDTRLKNTHRNTADRHYRALWPLPRRGKGHPVR